MSESDVQSHRMLVRLDGFEGPLDLLLDLARSQKLDIANISILALVDQYLAIIASASQIRLELAADWLVMAAWLAWLKSRLLTPSGTEEVEDAELLADTLASRLAELQAMRRVAQWLGAKPQLGVDVFGRGMPEDLTELDRSGLRLDVPSLLRGHVAAMRRQAATRRYVPRPMVWWSVQDALRRLQAMTEEASDWTELSSFLPAMTAAEPLARCAAIASTLLAGLELAQGGAVDLRQDESFGSIMLRRTQRSPA